MEKITGKQVETMMEAYASIYNNQEQEVISEEVAETEELQENQAANRARQQKLRQQQNAGRAQEQMGAKPRTGSFQDRRFARRSSSAAARANTNKVGQNIKVGSPTGPAQNDKLKKPAPTVLADKKPAQSPTSNLKPGSPNTVVSPKSGEETKFERRLPSMAELKAAQDARKAATAGGASKQEAEYQAVKAGVNAGKPAQKPASKPAMSGPGGYTVPSGAKPQANLGAKNPMKSQMTVSTPSGSNTYKPGERMSTADTATMRAAQQQIRSGSSAAKPAPTGAAGAAAKPAAAPVVKKPVRMGARNRMRMEELDVFDTIKEYLIGEGATEEEALKQMLTLTDEQRTEIIEGSCGSKMKKKKKGGY